MPKKKLTNAEVLKVMLEIDDMYLEQGEEGMLTEKFRATAQEVLEKGGDEPLFVNVLLNKALKPTEAINLTKRG